MNTMTQSPFNRTVFDIEGLGKRLLAHARNGGDPVAMNYSISRSDHCRLQAYDGDWIIPETAERQMLDFDSLERCLRSLMLDEPTWHVRISTHQYGVRLDPLIPMEHTNLITPYLAGTSVSHDSSFSIGYASGEVGEVPPIGARLIHESLTGRGFGEGAWEHGDVSQSSAIDYGRAAEHMVSMIRKYRPSCYRVYRTAGGELWGEMR